jgi:hypothetical protein
MQLTSRYFLNILSVVQRKLRFFLKVFVLIPLMTNVINAQQQSNDVAKNPTVADQTIKALMKKVDDLASRHKELEAGIIRERRNLDPKGNTSAVKTYLLDLEEIDKVYREHSQSLSAVGRYYIANANIIPESLSISPWLKSAIADRTHFENFSQEYDPLVHKKASQ